MKYLRKTTFCLIILLTFALVACGKRGAPKPPENLAPASVRLFTASANFEGVELSWVPPGTNATGEILDNLNTFLVRRSILKDGKVVSRDKIAEIRYDFTRGRSGLDKQLVYKDRTVKAGGVYEYRILAVNEDGQAGLPSSIVRVTFRGEGSPIEVY